MQQQYWCLCSGYFQKVLTRFKILWKGCSRKSKTPTKLSLDSLVSHVLPSICRFLSGNSEFIFTWWIFMLECFWDGIFWCCWIILGFFFQILVKAVPIKQGHKLNVSWPVTPSIHRYEEAPCRYLGHLIGHEGEGSLFHALKTLGMLYLWQILKGFTLDSS